MSQNDFEQSSSKDRQLSEVERHDLIESLKHCKERIEAAVEHASESHAFEMTIAAELIEDYRELGAENLAQRIGEEILPKGVMFEMQNVSSALSRGDLYEVGGILGHQVRKGSNTLRDQFPMEKSYRPALQICLDYALLTQDYGWAEGLYEDLGDNSGAAMMRDLWGEVKKKIASGEWKGRSRYIQEHSQEIIRDMQIPVSQFLAEAKHRPEDSVNLKELYEEMLKGINEALAQLQ